MNNQMKAYSVKLIDSQNKEHIVKLMTVDPTPEHIFELAKKNLLEGMHIEAEVLPETLMEVDAI